MQKISYYKDRTIEESIINCRNIHITILDKPNSLIQLNIEELSNHVYNEFSNLGSIKKFTFITSKNRTYHKVFITFEKSNITIRTNKFNSIIESLEKKYNTHIFEGYKLSNDEMFDTVMNILENEEMKINLNAKK